MARPCSAAARKHWVEPKGHMPRRYQELHPREFRYRLKAAPGCGELAHLPCLTGLAVMAPWLAWYGRAFFAKMCACNEPRK
eukprot:15257228-Alexandrium_andersonii.AAC.1